MRPEAPPYPPLSEEHEKTPAENPLAIFIARAMRTGFNDFEERLPGLLKPMLDEAATAAAVSVINAIGPRLNALESSERDTGRWRAAAESKLDELSKEVAELKAWRRDTERCGPPSEAAGGE